MCLNKIHVFSWHPPFEEQEKEAIYDQDNSIYRTCEEPQLHGPLYSFPQFHLWGLQDRIVHSLRPYCDLVPVIKRLYTLVGENWIVFPFQNDLNRFTDSTADICKRKVSNSGIELNGKGSLTIFIRIGKANHVFG
jgi:hypothetical protein